MNTVRMKQRLAAAGVTRLSDQWSVMRLAICAEVDTNAVVSLFCALHTVQGPCAAARSARSDPERTLRQISALCRTMDDAGLSSADRKHATLNLAQALLSGILRGDELRSLRDNGPQAWINAIAAAARATPADLGALGADGHLHRDVMARAIDALAAAQGGATS